MPIEAFWRCRKEGNLRVLDGVKSWAIRTVLRLSSYEGWSEIFNSATYSGVTVTPKGALGNTAVLRAITILSETIAQLPLHVIDESQNKKSKALDHPLFRVLYLEPNKLMSSFDLRQLMMTCICLYGNFFAEIEFNGAGDVIALYPWKNDKVTLFKAEDNTLWYSYRPDNLGDKEILIPGRRVLHIKAFSDNGLWGKSPIQIAREAVALSIAAEGYGAKFFGSGGKPTGVFSTDSKLKKDTIDRLQEQWKKRMGDDNSTKTLFLEEGLKYQPISLSPEDSQFIETRKFQISEIARMFGVPPHMLFDLDRATFANIEHQSIEFVTFSILPWIKRIEQEMTRKLFTVKDQSRYLIQFNVSGLLRGDTKSRFESYAIGKNAGFLTTNDIRKLEDMEPKEGGDVLWTLANTMPADISRDFWQSKITPVKEVNEIDGNKGDKSDN